MKKLSKTSLKEDIFISGIRNLVLYIRHNKLKVRNYSILTGVGIIACFIVWICVSSALKKNYQKFNEAFYTYQQAFLNPADKAGFKKAREVLAEYIQKYRFGKLTQIASFYKGVCSYYLGDYESARTEFQNFIKRYKNSYLLPFAYQSLGLVYEQLGKYKEAINIYQKLLDKKRRVFNASYCKLSIARCYEALGEYKSAKETYKEILTVYPDSAWAEEAKFFLEQLKERK
jgi:TolA-binding protein